MAADPPLTPPGQASQARGGDGSGVVDPDWRTKPRPFLKPYPDRVARALVLAEMGEIESVVATVVDEDPVRVAVRFQVESGHLAAGAGDASDNPCENGRSHGFIRAATRGTSERSSTSVRTPRFMGGAYPPGPSAEPVPGRGSSFGNSSFSLQTYPPQADSAPCRCSVCSAASSCQAIEEE
jgi:hypothetical protein